MSSSVSWLSISWYHSFVQLGSLCLNFPTCLLMKLSCGICKVQSARSSLYLNYVRLKILHLGDAGHGFDIFDIFPHVKRVVLIISGHCWLSGCPSSGQVCKTLSVTCENGLNIFLPDILGFMRGLCSFSLLCSRLSGVTPELIVNTAAAVGRRAVIENLPEKGACRVRTPTQPPAEANL